MEGVQRLKTDYPWIRTPLVVGAPMRLIALADMAVEVSKAGMEHLASSLLHYHVLTSYLFELAHTRTH
jgi:hypothetical protein